jgi:hypothetical protein
MRLAYLTNEPYEPADSEPYPDDRSVPPHRRATRIHRGAGNRALNETVRPGNYDFVTGHTNETDSGYGMSSLTSVGCFVPLHLLSPRNPFQVKTSGPDKSTKSRLLPRGGTSRQKSTRVCGTEHWVDWYPLGDDFMEILREFGIPWETPIRFYLINCYDGATVWVPGGALRNYPEIVRVYEQRRAAGN